jgi:CRP-like cAMP-binding protein
MREDDFACDLVGILDGAVEVSCGGSPVATLQAGEIVGELGCLSRGRRCATVVATEPVVLVRITHWDVRRLRQIAPAAVAAIVAVAEERERLIAA